MTETDDSIKQHLRGRPWVQTVSGRAFPLIEPEVCDVHWLDIIYALVHINRFAGHVGGYSVAQHTLHALPYLDPEHRPYWLLHDAHEAYMGDISTPVVQAIVRMVEHSHWTAGRAAGEAICSLKKGIDRAIYASVGLEWPVAKEIADVISATDKRMLMTERKDLFAHGTMDWGAEYDGVEPFDEIGRIVNPSVAYDRFARCMYNYFGIALPLLGRMEEVA